MSSLHQATFVHKKPATIKTIARALGISPSTVSRALNGDPMVKAETSKRIEEAAGTLGYRRDFRGVNLRTGKTFTLCAFLGSNPAAGFGDPAAMHLIQGLIAGVEGSDFKMVIRPVEGVGELNRALREAVENGRFDGFILDHTEPQDPRVRYLLEQGVPFVTFGRTELFTEHPYFDTDNEEAAYLATAHLTKLGHRRIALIDLPSNYLFTMQRRAGYARALEEVGVFVDPALLLEAPISPGRVADEVGRLLAMPQPPTGFVTVNEMATLGALMAARQLSPEAFAAIDIVSRDGTSFFDYVGTGVASCYFPLLEAGRALADTLVRAVRGAPVESLQRVEGVALVTRPRH